jgi:PIN domain nuclease of toxin-antitoxin system
LKVRDEIYNSLISCRHHFSVRAASFIHRLPIKRKLVATTQHEQQPTTIATGVGSAK